jgi:phage/plasmid-associated DNA primase
MDWFKKVFPDPKLLHHFLKFAASCLKGRNSDKLFPIFTGEGNNSKSMIVKLFEKTFGDYCVKFDISNVTSRNGNPNAPSPQLARSKATRLAFMDEPEDDIPLNKGVLKRWIGGDSFFCRMLQDNGGDVEVTFKLVLTCNKVPFIPKDTAITNRVDLYPFLGTWSRDAPASPEEQDRLHIYPLDELFENKIPALSLGFIWMITQYYVYYATEGLKHKPQIVIDTTEAYWRENDVYAQFAADCITEVIRDGVRDNSARVSLNQVYDEFKNWYKNSFPALKIPTRPVVKSELVSRWGKLAGKYWFGIKIIDDDEVIDIKSTAKKPVLLGEAAVITTKKRENPTLPDDNLVSEKSIKKVKTNAAAEGTVAF